VCTDSVQFGLGRFGSVRFGADQTGSVRGGPDRFGSDTGPVWFGHWTGSVRTLDRFGSDRFGSDTGPVRFGHWTGSVRTGSVRSGSKVLCGFFFSKAREGGDGEVERVRETRGRCEFDIPEVKMEVVEVNRCGVGPRDGGGACRKDGRGDRQR
jgi:hypothetical protein